MGTDMADPIQDDNLKVQVDDAVGLGVIDPIQDNYLEVQADDVAG